MTPNDCLRRLLLALGTAWLLAGCGLGEAPATQPTSPPPSTRATVADLIEVPCEYTITEFSPPGPDLDTVDPDFDIIGGVAALRTSKTAGFVAQLSAHGFYSDPTLRLAAKTPLLVRRGAIFELRVPDGFHDRVALDYGHSPRFEPHSGLASPRRSGCSSPDTCGCRTRSASAWRSSCRTPQSRPAH